MHVKESDRLMIYIDVHSTPQTLAYSSLDNILYCIYPDKTVGLD